MTKRRLIIMLAVVAMAMAVMAPASARGISNVKLDASDNWACSLEGPSSYVHCFGSGNGKTTSVMVFDSTDLGTDGNFLGTELLISADVYNGQPCASDNGEAYHDLGAVFACHHYGASA